MTNRNDRQPEQPSAMSHRIRPKERLRLTAPSGDACEIEARKDAKGRVYIVVLSPPGSPFRLTTPPMSLP